MHAMLKALLAFLLGLVAAPYYLWCWNQIAYRGLITTPVLSSGLRGSSYLVVITLFDFLAAVIILLPLALAIRGLGKFRLIVHTILGIIGLFCMLAIIVGLPLWPTTWLQLAGNLLPYAALCIGVLFSLAIGRKSP